MVSPERLRLGCDERPQPHRQQPEYRDRRYRRAIGRSHEGFQLSRSSPSERHDLTEPLQLFTSRVAPVEVRAARTGEGQGALLALDLPVFEPGLDGDRLVRPAGMVGPAPRADLDRRASLAQPLNRRLEGSMDHRSDLGDRDRESSGPPLYVVTCRGVIDLRGSCSRQAEMACQVLQTDPYTLRQSDAATRTASRLGTVAGRMEAWRPPARAASRERRRRAARRLPSRDAVVADAFGAGSDRLDRQRVEQAEDARCQAVRQL